MIRLTFLVLVFSTGFAAGQTVFSPIGYPLAKTDPVRDILHLERVGVYEIPDEEMTLNLEIGMVRWNKTLSWLGGNMERRNQLTVMYKNPETGKWHIIGTGFVAGGGVRFWTKYDGEYLVELRNPDHPIVISGIRKGDSFEASAYVVCD